MVSHETLPSFSAKQVRTSQRRFRQTEGKLMCVPTWVVTGAVASVLLFAVGCSGDEAPDESVTDPSESTAQPEPTANEAAEEPSPTPIPAPEVPEPSVGEEEPEAPVSLWTDVTDEAIGPTSQWTNKVDLADIDGDGDVDLLFADGGKYDTPGEPLINQIFVNDGNGVFSAVSEQVLGPEGDLARVIKARDLNGDGIVDIIVGTTFETQSRLYLGEGGLDFVEVTATHLPQMEASVGDVEVGDVDGDGDLDLVLADWGPGSPLQSEGAPPLLWLNDGTGVFSDASVARIPQNNIGFSWELELVDVDNDYDLDIAVSCKVCDGSFLYHNDGTGSFTDATDQLPQRNNNYDFEAIDLDGDGFLDLTTINDGRNLTQRVLLADGSGGFVDATEELWPEAANPTFDDNVVVYLDFDSDGDADILIGSLGGPDRILVNDGTGHLSLFEDPPFGDVRSRGTLGMAVADLNGDGKLDVVEAQGEVSLDEKVYLGTAISPDTAPPVISGAVDLAGTIHARIHDNKSPTVPHDWQDVFVENESGKLEMQWYGEYLWRVDISDPGEYRVCATDAAGNTACSEPLTVQTAAS
jgi:hypothetical protein